MCAWNVLGVLQRRATPKRVAVSTRYRTGQHQVQRAPARPREFAPACMLASAWSRSAQCPCRAKLVYTHIAWAPRIGCPLPCLLHPASAGHMSLDRPLACKTSSDSQRPGTGHWVPCARHSRPASGIRTLQAGEQGAYPRPVFLEEYGLVGGVRERGAVSIEVALKPLVCQLAWGYIPLVCMSSRTLSASTVI